jgi:uncharacterized protein YegJ (DUF2314 family)
MKLVSGLAALAVLAVAGCDQGAETSRTAESGREIVEREGNPDVVMYAKDDGAMAAAITDAQGHLDYFWERFDAPAPGEENFMLKVAFPVPGDTEGGREHIWVSDIETAGGGHAGLLANEPYDIDGAYGDRVEFTGDMITDWGFIRDGMMIGYYTTRVSLADADPAEAEAIRAVLGENPE